MKRASSSWASRRGTCTLIEIKQKLTRPKHKFMLMHLEAVRGS